MGRQRKTTGLLALALGLAVMALPQAAVAQDCDNVATDPTAAQYCPPVQPDDGRSATGAAGGGGSQGGGGPGEPAGAAAVPAPAGDGAGTLPFTGLDLAALLAAALGLAAAGFGLRRVASRGEA